MAKKFNQTAINTAVHAVLTTADKMTAQMADLMPLLEGSDRKTGRTLLLPAVALHYKVPTVESDSDKNRGEIVMDADHPRYETAKKQLSRLLNALYVGAATSSKVEVPAELDALMVKLTKKYTRKQILAAMTGKTFLTA